MHRLILAALFIVSLTAGTPPKKNIVRIDFHSEVDPMSVAVLMAQIEAAQTSDGIVIDIDTPGGYVFAGLEGVAAIENSQVPVICSVSGMAASMGSVLLQACDYRVMTSGTSVIMIHALQGGAEGTPDEVLEKAKEMKELDDRLLNYEVRRTNVSAETIRALIPGKKMLWMDAALALKLGFIDEIIQGPL
jgi:ATP-dependent Clp protease protease subunit